MAKGVKTGGGSRKGSPNRITKELKEMILGALDDAGGQSYLLEQASENPTAFLTLIGKILPKQVDATVDVTISPASELIKLKQIAQDAASRD